MLIYEGEFPIGTFVKHKISKEIYMVRAISTKDKTGRHINYSITNGMIVTDVLSDEIIVATDEEIEEAGAYPVLE